MPAENDVFKPMHHPHVYVMRGGSRHWIPDPSTLEAQFGGWNAVVTLPDAEVDAIPVGDPIPSVLTNVQWPDNALVTAPPDPGVYVIRQGVRHLYPNAPTFLSDGGAWNAIESIPQSVLNSIPLGSPIPPITRYIVDTGIIFLGGWSSHQVQTRAGLSITTGKIDALTHTRTTTAFGGFHVGICCILTDTDGLPVDLGQTPMQRYGVDGTWIGNSDRTDAWFASIAPKEAERVQEITVYQTWQPDTFERVLDKWSKAEDAALKGIGAFNSSVGGISKATTSKAQ